MSKFHQLKVKDIRKETADTVSVAFEVPDVLQEVYEYKAGQYLTLRTAINGEDVRRSYSICTAPAEKDLRVAVKQVEAGRFSTFANTILKAGDELEVMTPTGNFTQSEVKGTGQRYVAFASGSGITPVIAILKTILFKEPDSHVTLFYGNRNFESIIFREELEALKNKYLGRFSLYHILSRENLGVPLFNGRIDNEKIEAFAKVFFDPTLVSEYFICGPEPMIHAVKNGLEAMQVSGKIHFELFTSPAGSLAPEKKEQPKDFDPAKESHVTIKLDGDVTEFALAYGGDSILDAAMKAGADLPFACKGGVCCTCRAHLQEGEVEMDVNYALEPDEVEAGFILTCQSHPRTSRVVVDFDRK